MYWKLSLILLIFLSFISSTNASDNVIENCWIDLINSINNTSSWETLEVRQNWICEINTSINISKSMTLQVVEGYDFTLKLTSKVDSFIILNSNDITFDGFKVNVNNNANEWIRVLWTNINVSHNKIFNIYSALNNIDRVSWISFIPNLKITSSWSNVIFNHNEFYNVKKSLGLNSIINSIYINLWDTWSNNVDIKWNIFNKIDEDNSYQIYITNSWTELSWIWKIYIENNSFVTSQDNSIYSDLEDSVVSVSWNTYDIEDATPTEFEEYEDLDVWTIEKATHLAKKVLYWATQEKINELFQAWSREAAVDILFPSIEWANRTEYNNKMSELLDESWLNKTSDLWMREYYALKKLEDPYEAKSKLFSIFEDTFAVDTIYNRINYWDIEKTHDLLYSYTLWNYKEMVKRNLYNNGNWGDYSLWEYLNLFNQTNPSRPNENYAREILQLFLMLEYLPTESEDTWWKRNYSEEDVNAMAKIIFGFESDENTHKVTYNSYSNTNKTVEFLDWDLKAWDSFAFYNTWSWILDIQEMKKSINWNNWLPDNVIDYIFSKRDYEISMFLADKLYRFYIAPNPSRDQLDLISSKILENNFEIYPTVKWLLSTDMMYSKKSVESIIYKNPLELVIWISKQLWLTSDDVDFRYILTSLNWTPYVPWKIFWRDWFDDNSIFYTSYVANRWANEAPRFAKNMIDKDLSIFDWIENPWELIAKIEQKLYLWTTLDENTRASLIEYLTHDKDWNEVLFDLSNNDYISKNVHGLIYIMLNFPEYILQSGYNSDESVVSEWEEFYTNDNKIVFIKAWGWLDWLHAIVPKEDYQEYLDLRWSWALVWTGLTSLNDDLYINSSLKPFTNLYDSNNLRVINRVWTPDHSRGHDSASRKVTSLNNLYGEDDWIFGHFIKNEDSSKTIVLNWSTKPLIFRWGRYMWIGWDATFIINYSYNPISWDEREYKVNVLKELLENRDYSGSYWNTFVNSSVIDSVAKKSVENWWRWWSWYNMEQRFAFLESLYDEWLWNAVWLNADGWYDTHTNQKDYLNWNFDNFSTQITNFFNRVKDKHDVTIVLYSEFWRTNAVNSWVWFDHGKGGWMFIVSNNENLLNNQLPQKVYGNNLVKDSSENYLGVGIDYRSVYTSLFKWVFSKDISSELWWNFNINDYIDANSPDTELFRIENKYYNDYSYRTYFKFNVDDKNYFWSEWSDIKFEYWSDTDEVKEISYYWLHNYFRTWERNYDINLVTTIWKKYYYKITLIDNQYNKKVINGSFVWPELNKTNTNISTEKSSYFKNFRNTVFSGSLLLPSTDAWIVLSNSWIINYSTDSANTLEVWSGTYVKELLWSSWAIWKGWFILPTIIDKNLFIWSDAKYNNDLLSYYKMWNLVKVWADDLWISMQLNKNVKLKLSWVDSSKNYAVVYSNDWVNWNDLVNPNITKDWDNFSFEANHFTYFLLLEADASWNPIKTVIDDWRGEVDSWDDNMDNEIIWYPISGWWSAPVAKKDYCIFWDFSESYYDKICWIDPDSQMIHDSKFSTWAVLEFSLDELSYYDNSKYLLYLEIFNDDREVDDLYDTKKIIITKLREWYIYKDIDSYNLVHVKNFTKYNSIFEKITKFILSKQYVNSVSKDVLVNNLNDIIVLFSIYKEEWINNSIKVNIKNLLLNRLNKLSNDYKSFKIKKTVGSKKVIYSYIEETTNNNLSKDTSLDINDEAIYNTEQNDNSKYITNSEYVYKLWVKSVILKADAYWKNNIWTLYYWDLVEQITNIHPKWFFKVRVIKSKEWLDWKEGYIFAKYLEK